MNKNQDLGWRRKWINKRGASHEHDGLYIYMQASCIGNKVDVPPQFMKCFSPDREEYY